MQAWCRPGGRPTRAQPLSRTRILHKRSPTSPGSTAPLDTCSRRGGAPPQLDRGSSSAPRMFGLAVAGVELGMGGPGHKGPGPPMKLGSVAGPEGRARYRGEYLLLVVDGAAIVAHHPGGVVGGDHQRIDVAPGDRQPEVVADERVGGAWVLVGCAGHLVDAVDGLPGLLGVPAEL